MSEWLRWRQGRQGTGYEKMLLFKSSWLKCDLWLLRSGVGVEVPEHRDPAPDGYLHLRVNAILRPATDGGEFHGAVVYVDRPRLKIFRSDFPHRVTKIKAGSRLVLSAGILLNHGNVNENAIRPPCEKTRS